MNDPTRPNARIRGRYLDETRYLHETLYLMLCACGASIAKGEIVTVDMDSGEVVGCRKCRKI